MPILVLILLVPGNCLVATRAGILIRGLLRRINWRVNTIASILEVNAAVALLEIHVSDTRLERAVVFYVLYSDAAGIEG